MKILFTRLFALALGLSISSACLAVDAVLPKEMKLAFLGDSITEIGNSGPGGYVQLVVSGLEANGVKVTSLPSGCSGNTSNDMLARLTRDVISKKPDWMTLSCGVNDAWHEPVVPLELFKTNITSIIDQAQAAGIKVMVLTATIIFENIDSKENKRLVAYNDFLRAIAAERKCLLADLNAGMWPVITAAKLPPDGRLFTGDGVHMNMHGNLFMAKGVLKGFGMSDAQLDKAWQSWMKIQNVAYVGAGAQISFGEYFAFKEKAAKENITIEMLMDRVFHQSLDPLRKSLGK